MTRAQVTNLDHVVVATPDLEATVADFEAATGVTPQFGGAHPGRGSRNYLVTFGDGAYLEIISADPDQPEPAGPRPFLIDERTEAVVATWAAHPGDIERRAAEATVAGLPIGDVADGARRDPSGTLIEWRVTPTLVTGRDGTVPFLIDWGTTPSPADTVSARAELTEFTVLHPDADALAAHYALLGVSAPIEQADEASLRVAITGPNGTWRLG